MVKNAKLKTAITIVTVILLIVLLYFYLGMVLVPKDTHDRGGSDYYYETAIFTERENSLDVLFMGNSDLYSAVNPLQIFKDTGITSYTCGAAQQNVRIIKQDLREILKKQSPKVVVIDVDCFYPTRTRYNSKRATAVIAPFQYHVRWKQLKLRDFYTFPKYIPDDNKGYLFYDKVVKYSLKPDFMQNVNAQAKQTDKTVYANLVKIKKLCDKNGIELLFICVPTPASWSNAKSNAVKQFAQQLNVTFLDMNYPNFGDDYEYGFEFDYSNYFRDRGDHLNFNGATVVSKFMANYLQQNYDIEDKRQSEEYADWNTLIEKHSNRVV